MERLLLDTTWLQEAIYPFLGAGDLLELGQVNRHFRNDTEDYFDQYQHGRKEGYFHHSCQMICFHDPLILVGLLLDEETYRVFFLQENKEMLKFLDEWPNDHTATVPMLDQIRATSWRNVCLRLLDRIRAIEEIVVSISFCPITCRRRDGGNKFCAAAASSITSMALSGNLRSLI